MGTDDGSFFGASEEQFGDWRDWLDWAESLVAAILLASQRVSLALAAGGFAIAGSNLIDKAPMLGQLSMGAAGVFGVWIAVASVKSVKSGR